MLGRAVAVFLSLFLSAGAAISQCDYTPRYSGQYRSSFLDLAIDANDLWAATSYGIQLLDRSVTPPRPIASVAVPGITRVVRATGGTAYAGSGSAVYVVRKSGDDIAIVRSVDAGATINDLLLLPGYLYAATSNGVVQFDLSDSTTPVRTSAQFATSANAVGLAVQGTTLYVADSDSSVEHPHIATENRQPVFPAPLGERDRHAESRLCVGRTEHRHLSHHREHIDECRHSSSGYDLIRPAHRRRGICRRQRQALTRR
jgi:predicted nucleic acid-binding Zn ribbon protein